MDVSLSLVVLERLFNLVYFVDPSDYWVEDCNIQHWMQTNTRRPMVWLHRVEVLAAPPSLCLAFIVAPEWWEEYERLRYLYVIFPLMLAFTPIWSFLPRPFVSCLKGGAFHVCGLLVYFALRFGLLMDKSSGSVTYSYVPC